MATPDPEPQTPTGSTADLPDESDLRAYLAGSLDPARFARVDAWLAALPADEAERRLAALDAPGRPLDLPVQRPGDGFVAEAAAGRLRRGEALGSGGMASVVCASDRALEREVALKILRPRQDGEDLEAYLLREAAFRREAALTAALDHPAIVPVHDIGRCDGRPAFTMKRLDGRPLDEVVATGSSPLAELVQILIHVADAIAFAHSRGIVHRDLTPANVLVGGFGAVYVIDWGLAAPRGTADGVRAGTTGWMAPEQAAGAVADPRMDVHALGGLLRLILGTDPPRGLAAVARRCLAADPAARYADAGEVAAELRRWLDDGVTAAQEAGAFELAWLRLRRSRRARGILVAAAVAAAAAAGLGLWLAHAAEADARARIARLGREAPLDRPEAIALALTEATAVAREHPRLPEAAALVARLDAALAVARSSERAAADRARIDGLLARTRRIGPWGDQIEAWRSALGGLGLGLDPAHRETDLRLLAGSPLRTQAMASLAFLWRAQREQGDTAGAEASAGLLAAAGPTTGWQALGRLLGMVEFRAHDPVLCRCDDSEAVLADPGAAAVALALFAPEERLTRYARERLAASPGDFWPLIAAARAALAAHDQGEAERLAWTASGAEPDSLLPRLLLAYVDLGRSAWPSLLAQTGQGLAADPGNTELLALRAVALARSGRAAEAQAVVDRLPAGHLRYHLAHRVGHPMELAVDALVAAGLAIGPAAPDLGPLTPHRHH